MDGKRWGFLVFLLLVFFGSGCFGRPERPLTVYTYSSFPPTLVEDIVRHFQEEYEVTVEFKSFSDTGPLLNQLAQEKKDPQADVVIGLDNNYLPKALALGVLEPYKPQAAGGIRSDLVFDPDFYLTPFDYGFVVFNYDSERLAQTPTSHRDLLRPEYKGKIIIENPLTSSPGQVFLLTTIALYGEEGYLDYWRALKPNLLTITSGWDEAYGIFTSGEAPLVLSYGASPVYHLIYEESERYKALVLDGGAYAQIEGVGIVKGTPQPENARRLVDYILSPEFQTLIPETQFMYPVRADLELPASFRVAARAERLFNLSPAEVDANLERWLSAWEQVMNE
ncbi:MAG TPA: thiamine ABC transporter substrate-binding protein [Firmicutes bacterium]|jgi:thiamine transport system substrate-binding protein|nr:thiamine ABC transporter substrate-binding protein [Bacillota bacterium]